MGKIIIGIHGLGNKPSRKIRKEWWRQSIEEGRQKYTNFKGDVRCELVY